MKTCSLGMGGAMRVGVQGIGHSSVGRALECRGRVVAPASSIGVGVCVRARQPGRVGVDTAFTVCVGVSLCVLQKRQSWSCVNEETPAGEQDVRLVLLAPAQDSVDVRGRTG